MPFVLEIMLATSPDNQCQNLSQLQNPICVLPHFRLCGGSTLLDLSQEKTGVNLVKRPCCLPGKNSGAKLLPLCCCSIELWKWMFCWLVERCIDENLEKQIFRARSSRIPRTLKKTDQFDLQTNKCLINIRLTHFLVLISVVVCVGSVQVEIDLVRQLKISLRALKV